MGVLKTLAILIIVYYIFKFFVRYIGPIFLKKVVSNVEKKFNEQQQNQANTTEGEVGETIIAKKPVNQKQSNKNVGDYVDYEEVNED